MDEKKARKIAIIIACVCAVAVIASWAVQYWIQGYSVFDQSMVPNLPAGTMVWARRDRDVDRGRVVAFRKPDAKAIRIARVIGVGGEVIEIREGMLVRDGKEERELYVKDASGADFGPVKVPEGHYVILNDNRDEAGSDSRIYGTIPRERIVGPVIGAFCVGRGFWRP